MGGEIAERDREVSLMGKPISQSHCEVDLGMTLWIRHLAQLSPPEKAAIESRTRMTTQEREEIMKKSHPEPE
jgi:hypothetical protein